MAVHETPKCKRARDIINHDLRGRFIKIPNLLGRLESLPKKVDTSLKTEEFSKRISFQCSVSVAGIPSPRNMDINSTAMVCQKRQKRHQHQLPHLPPRCCSAVVFWRSPGGCPQLCVRGVPISSGNVQEMMGDT